MPQTIRPFWGRVTVVESPLDVEERSSGLIVPRSALAGEEHDAAARRGVVQEIEVDVLDGATRQAAEKIAAGMVVYFRRPTRIEGDVLVVEFSDILAYET